MGDYVLSSYISGIAVFLIFASLVSLLAPQKKYKEYIDLIMALGLILVLITPIGSAVSFLSGSNNFGSLNMSVVGLAPPNVEGIEQTQRILILQQYAGELNLHLERIVDNDGQFSIAYSRFYLDDSIENFGLINGISIWAREQAVTAIEPTPRPFIRVERIEITPFTQNTAIAPALEEDARINSLKNIISSFYQIRNEHINIFVVD